MLHAQNVFISVDIETSGHNPSDYAMLSLGACRVDRPDVSFYVELRPDRPGINADAVEISGLDPARLWREGLEPRQALLDQADALVLSVVEALEGEHETAIVRSLLRLRAALSDDRTGQAWAAQVEATRAEVINLVNNFFYDRLTGYPTVRIYIDSLHAS